MIFTWLITRKKHISDWGWTTASPISNPCRSASSTPNSPPKSKTPVLVHEKRWIFFNPTQPGQSRDLLCHLSYICQNSFFLSLDRQRIRGSEGLIISMEIHNPKKNGCNTPLKFNSAPLKNGGWKTIWVSVTFQGRAVKLQGGMPYHRVTMSIYKKSELLHWCSCFREIVKSWDKLLLIGSKLGKNGRAFQNQPAQHHRKIDMDWGWASPHLFLLKKINILLYQTKKKLHKSSAISVSSHQLTKSWTQRWDKNAGGSSPKKTNVSWVDSLVSLKFDFNFDISTTRKRTPETKNRWR